MINVELTGNVWATRKLDIIQGYKLMIGSIIGGINEGEKIVVVDTIGAGIGDRVIVVRGSSARIALGDNNIPIDATVIGIIDSDCSI